MKIVGTVITDGRLDFLKQTMAALEQHVSPVDELILINDSGDAEYARTLEETFPQFDHYVHHETRRGLGGAVQSAWSTAVEHCADYVWHQEDDMVVIGDVDLNVFADHLKLWPHLAQVALNRKPLSDAESPAISVVAAHPEMYTEFKSMGVTWCETQHLFVFSPSLIPRRVIDHALADADVFLEREVTDALWPYGYHSCYWGAKGDGPLCHHIGTVRSAGYHW